MSFVPSWFSTQSSFRPVYSPPMTAQLIDQLAAAPKMLANLVVEASDDALDLAPRDGRAARTILAHLRDCEFLEMRLAVERMLAEEVPSLEFIDSAAWEPVRNRTRDRKEWLLGDFALQRLASVGILRSLRPEDWEREGSLRGSGTFSLRTFVEGWVKHDAQHTRQLEVALGETLGEVLARRARMAE